MTLKGMGGGVLKMDGWMKRSESTRPYSPLHASHDHILWTLWSESTETTCCLSVNLLIQQEGWHLHLICLAVFLFNFFMLSPAVSKYLCLHTTPHVWLRSCWGDKTINGSLWWFLLRSVDEIIAVFVCRTSSNSCSTSDTFHSRCLLGSLLVHRLCWSTSLPTSWKCSGFGTPPPQQFICRVFTTTLELLKVELGSSADPKSVHRYTESADICFCFWSGFRKRMNNRQMHKLCKLESTSAFSSDEKWTKVD